MEGIACETGRLLLVKIKYSRKIIIIFNLYDINHVRKVGARISLGHSNQRVHSPEEHE